MELQKLEIIVGTYEEFLLGYRVLQKLSEEYDLIQSFATHSHRASVRSVATGGKFLASGGTDESIFLYDMTTRKEAGLLMQHNGTISCLDFAPNGTHLLSGSEDGSIGACRTGSWQLEKLWSKAHKGSSVTSVSIHPSGKLFLSVGFDGTIRTWNFVKGRPAYATHLCKLKEARSITQVLWCPEGDTYSVAIGKRVEVFNVAEAKIVYTVELESKITCICYVNANILCAASEDGNISVCNIEEKTLISQSRAHEGRVRCISCYKSKFLVSGSSAGQIKLWNIMDPAGVGLVELSKIDTGCRITCMTVVEVENTFEFDEVQSKKLMPVKLEPEVVQSNKRPRNMGYVTVEVDEPESEKSASVNIHTKKKKRKKKFLKNSSFGSDKGQKHKKKKTDHIDIKSTFIVENVNDVREDNTDNTSINGKLKKKSEMKKLRHKSSKSNIGMKTLNKKADNVVSVGGTNKLKKKSRTGNKIEESPAHFGKGSRKRKSSEFEVVDLEEVRPTSTTQNKKIRKKKISVSTVEQQ